MSYEFSDILKLLPHRHPFLFVDKIVSVKLGESVHAQKNVSINEDFFNGHFPNKPVMPGEYLLFGWS
jgi:3-hydroxyacyl-[acyl-carrier-protein] dehydratase